MAQGGRLLALIVVAIAVVAGCSSSSPSPTPFAARVLPTDLSVGNNRVVFMVVGEEGDRLQLLQAEVAAYYLASEGEDTGVLRDRATATFRQWPVGNAGVYTANLTLDVAGEWRAQVELDTENGERVQAEGFFRVRSNSATPAIGSPVPPSETKTLGEVASLEKITSSLDPDPDLYQISVAEAVRSGKPSVVVFATPAFCQTATCGPQVEEVQALKEKYHASANFIHVEIYDNPDEIQGDLSRAVIASAVREWALPTEPFTFVLDREGRVASKFEGFTTMGELEPALLEVLG